MRDERLAAQRLLGRLEVSTMRPLMLFIGSVAAGLAGAYLFTYEGLEDPGRKGLFILFTSAALWVTEAIPAFATGLVVMALALLMLGDVAPASVFLAPWASPIIWLFFGGFVLAAAASRTGLDRWLAGWILSFTGDAPAQVLAGAMIATFAFSMFMSNTATATMMLTMLLPVLANLDQDDSFRYALPLGIAFAANIGGMGTIIGSPPNAIAAGLLTEVSPVNFFMWSLAALPVATVLAVICWWFLCRWYPSSNPIDLSVIKQGSESRLPVWQRLLVMAVFVVTLLLWLTSPLHGFPTSMVAFLPIVVLTISRTISAEDIRQLPWDVLLLIAGGLCLGEVVERTGLTSYLVGVLPIEDLGPLALALGLAWVCSILSNLMSNTAAANILLPLALALTGGRVELVMPIALAASAAMCLPVSTPPNALAASKAKLKARDFLPGGLLIGLICAPLAVAMCYLVLGSSEVMVAP